MTPDEAFSTRALLDATRRAAAQKRSRGAVARFLLELPTEVSALRDELVSMRWQPSRPRRFAIRDPKPREISVLPFRDRVVQHALCAAMAPRVERRLIADTFACREGLGTHAALRRARAWARTYRHFVHLDVARYFPTIDHGVVRSQIARDLREPWIREYCDRILRAGADGAAVGLPIGNLTSQLWANRYLDPVDHLVKDAMRVRGYLRYMDDMLVFHDDPMELRRIARRIEEACAELRLALHRWDVRPTWQGVTALGYRILGDHVRVRRTTVARAERRLLGHVVETERGERAPEELIASIRATFAHWRVASTWRLRRRTLARIGMLATPGHGLDDGP